MVQEKGQYVTDQRKNRIEQILNTLREAKKKDIVVNLSRLKNESCYQLGVSKRTMEEYINALNDAGKIKISEEPETGIVIVEAI